jgi:hypothetical protein
MVFGHARPEPLRGWRKWAAAGTAVLSLVGACAPGGNESSDEAGVVYSNSAGDQAARGQLSSEFRRILSDDTKPDIAQARELVPRIAGTNPILAYNTWEALEATNARLILTDTSKKPESESGFVDRSADLDTIKDPSIRKETSEAIYVGGIQSALERYSSSDDSLSTEQIRNDIAARMPTGAEPVKEHADIAVDVMVGEDIIKNFELQGDETKAKGALGNVEDLGIRALTGKGIDAADAEQALIDLAFNGATTQETRKDVADVTDAGIRRKALAAIKATENGDEYAASEVSTTISLDGYDIETQLLTRDNAFDEDKMAASTYPTELTLVRQRAINEMDVYLGNEFAKQNKIIPGETRALTSPYDPTEVIDLTHVEGKRTVGFQPAEEDSRTHELKEKQSYQQFGEIYAQDGKLVFDLQEGGGLDAKARQQLLASFEHSRSFVEAAFASGEVVSVRFVIGSGFEPFYASTTREVFMVLPKDDSTSIDQLFSATRHEVFHGISRDTFRGYELTQKDKVDLSSACNNLKATAYQSLEYSLATKPEVLTNLRSQAKSEHKPIIDTLINAVDKGTLASTLMLTPKEVANMAGPTLNECLAVRSASGLLYGAENRTKDSDATTEELAYITSTAEWVAFAKEWFATIDYASVYDTVNESSYVETGYIFKDSLGHSEEDDREAYASILNGALSWPDKFEAGLEELNEQQYKAIMEMLEWCVRDMEKDPGLKDYAIGIRQRYGLDA